MSPRLPVLALAALALVTAGCLGGDGGASGADPGTDPGDDPGTDDGGGDDGSGPDGYAPPRWAPGLYWSYEVTWDGGTGLVTFAVQDESDGRFTLLANATDHAAADALEDLAYVGPVRADDLAGLVDGDPVRFFEWPLRDGRTWETTWNGIQRTHVAEERPVETLGTTLAGVEVTSSAGNRTLATYTYAPAVGWFTSLELHDRNRSYELVDAGFGYGGNLTRTEAEVAFEAASPSTGADAVAVPEAADRVGVQVAGGGDRASYDLSLADPNGTRHEYGPEACMACTVDVLDLLPAVPGRWTVQASLASTSPGNLTAQVSLVRAEAVPVDYGG